MGRKVILQIQIKPTLPPMTKSSQVVGIDLGRRDIAHTSEGESFSGDTINRVRDKFAKVRASAQHNAAKGTRSTRRRCRGLLQRLSGRERRFQGQVNHTISFRLVKAAKEQGHALAIAALGRLVDSPRGPGLFCALHDSLRAPESSVHTA